MITKLFADRLAEFGIPVNEVRPGIIATDMTSKVKEKYDTLIENGLLPINNLYGGFLPELACTHRQLRMYRSESTREVTTS